MPGRRSFPISHRRSAGIALGALLICGLPAQAAVIIDHFDTSGGFDLQSGVYGAASYGIPGSFGDPSCSRTAIRFTVTGGSYELISITMPISEYLFGGSHNLRVRLTDDAGGTPGATRELLSENQAIWPARDAPLVTATTLISVSHPTLSNGASYWIVTEPTSIPGVNGSADYLWYYNTSGEMTTCLNETETQLPTDPWDNPPVDLNAAFRVEGTLSTTGVGQPVIGESPLELGRPWPNPFPGLMRMDLRLGSPAEVAAEVFDVMGHRVRTLLSGVELPAGPRQLEWDGRGGSGRRVAPGLYVIRVTAGSATGTRRIAVTQ